MPRLRPFFRVVPVTFAGKVNCYEDCVLAVRRTTVLPAYSSPEKSCTSTCTIYFWMVPKKEDGTFLAIYYIDDNTRNEQAEWTVQAFQILAEHNTGPAFVYNLDSQVVEPKSAMAQWSIVDGAWNPLPVYDALKEIVPRLPAPTCFDSRSVLTSPTEGKIISGTAEIRGTATHEAFQYYKLEYTPGINADGGGNYFDGNNLPIDQGSLGTLDTTSLVNGDYSIRLIVVEQTGNFLPPCQVNVTVQN